MEIEKKLDLIQIAKEIQGAEFNPKKFPGLVMKIEKPYATIILFSDGKLTITNLKNPSEVNIVIDIFIEKIRSIGIIIPRPKLTIESNK
jgi:transcription initiation factor TFIID TATA-box-binding protein